jgi:CBS domain-containing protein
VVEMEYKDLKDLRVGDIFDIVTGKPAIVNEDSMLKDAVEAITQTVTSHKVYVVDSQRKLKGVITIETLLKQVGYKAGIRETGMVSFFKFLSGVFKENVTEFMEKPVAVTKDHFILEALQKMVEYHLNDLPIIDDDEHIIGELHSIEILKNTKKYFKE